MSAVCRNFDSRRRIARAAIMAGFFVVSSALAVSAQTTPSALVQNSTLSGTTNTINITQLPVVTSTGKIIYDNVVIQFDVADDGALTVAKGFPQFTPSPEPIDNGFKAGTYVGPDDSTELITVYGPGVDPSGATVWSLGPASKASGLLCPITATWYDVGTKLSNNMIYPRLKAAGITSTMLQYGTGHGSDGCGGQWETNSLLGFSQTNGALTITSFSFDGGTGNVSTDTKTYRLQP